jgi:hypothetical protein
MRSEPDSQELIKAAEQWDWVQIVLHEGEPCFHLCENGHFCGRAKSWAGHNDLHRFAPLSQAFVQALKAQREQLEEDFSCELKETIERLDY